MAVYVDNFYITDGAIRSVCFSQTGVIALVTCLVLKKKKRRGDFKI